MTEMMMAIMTGLKISKMVSMDEGIRFFMVPDDVPFPPLTSITVTLIRPLFPRRHPSPRSPVEGLVEGPVEGPVKGPVKGPVEGPSSKPKGHCLSTYKHGAGQ
ncbi:hypothetical protein Tco_0152476 [Tanacetum coccineum]